ncbi:MAG: DUF5060 domain-containing protein [bacterium]|jgi:hypothetical protein
MREIQQMMLSLVLVCTFSLSASAGEAGSGRVYSVIDLTFTGPMQGPRDTPARDIIFHATFTHESGSPEYQIHGFWDGDGRGASQGNVFKIRFCPTKRGRWIISDVYSNEELLNDQKEDDYITARSNDHPGFWIVDEDSPDRRWYRRSDGSHHYIFGNTMYSFLSGSYVNNQSSGNDIKRDIQGNAEYFRKLRFALHGDRYPNPNVKPYFDDEGNPTDDGDFSVRPNPEWFHSRVDLAVRTAYEEDLIADLILAGPDTEDSRSTLRAGGNDGDPEPYLRYIAARYGSFPNVWICLANEFEIREPKWEPRDIARFGGTIVKYLPYPTPLSVHSTPNTLWAAEFDKYTRWYDHLIIQDKIRNLAQAADVVQKARRKPDGGMRNLPVINDELSYEGEGDKHSEEDTIESHLGIFAGGAYGTTGEKPGNKLGQYFRGRFNAQEHKSADNLKWLGEVIDQKITFWKMRPDKTIFSNLGEDFRGMAWKGKEYILATNSAKEDLKAELPQGKWSVTQYNVINKEQLELAPDAEGEFIFKSPDSRAVLFHFKKVE